MPTSVSFPAQRPRSSTTLASAYTSGEVHHVTKAHGPDFNPGALVASKGRHCNKHHNRR